MVVVVVVVSVVVVSRIGVVVVAVFAVAVAVAVVVVDVVVVDAVVVVVVVAAVVVLWCVLLGCGSMCAHVCAPLGAHNAMYVRVCAAPCALARAFVLIFTVFHVCAVCFARVWEYVRPCMCAPGGA